MDEMIKKLCQRIIFLVTNLEQDKCQLQLLPVETNYFLDKFQLISSLTVRKQFSKKLLDSSGLPDLSSCLDSDPVLIYHSLLSANQPLSGPSLSILNGICSHNINSLSQHVSKFNIFSFQML